MRYRIAALALCAGALIQGELSAQIQTRVEWKPITGSLGVQSSDPTTGSIIRTRISNEYLDVTVGRGTVHVIGATTDVASWNVQVRGWRIFTLADSGHPVALESLKGYVSAGPGPDRYVVNVGYDADPKGSRFEADVRLTVPHDLKMLHLNLRTGGRVVVDDYAGELTVTSDSGDIVGTRVAGPISFEARNGGVELDLSQSAGQRRPVSLLSHNGSITVVLPAQPSVNLSLDATCGRINADFKLPMTRPIKWQFGKDLKPVATDVNCDLRPKSLPTLEGVEQLRYGAESTLGDGTVSLRAVALMGDINLKRAVASSSAECVQVPDLGRNPDGSAVLAAIVGRILDADGATPLSGAHLQIIGTQFGATTDKNGQYRLEFDPHVLDKCHNPYIQVAAPGHTTETVKLFVAKMTRSDDVILHRTKPQGEYPLPDTPPGRAAAGWIRAVNSADSATMWRFAFDSMLFSAGDSAKAAKSASAMLRTHATDGRLVPYEIRASDDRHVSVAIDIGPIREPLVYTFYAEPEMPHRLTMVIQWGKAF